MKGSTNLIIIGSIFLASGYFSHISTAEDFKKYNRYQNDVTVVAQTVKVEEIKTFFARYQVVTVEFKDESGALVRGIIERTGDYWFTNEFRPLISYRPDNPEMVRWPRGQMSPRQHQVALAIFKAFMLFGIVLLAVPVLRFFRQDQSLPAR